MQNVKDPTTRAMIETAIEKLRTDGPSRVAKPVATVPGLFEVRPGGGQTTWRPLFVRHGDRYVIVALAREAVENPAGFEAGVGRARRRAAGLTAPQP